MEYAINDNNSTCIEIKIAEAFEEDCSAIRTAELSKNPIKGDFDYEHLQHIHQIIFQDVYQWTGTPRTIAIRKKEQLLGNRSVAYPDPQSDFPPHKMKPRAKYAFSELEKDKYLTNLSVDKFVAKLVKHSTEIWEVHAFREGNTRTVASFIEQLS